MPQAKSLAQCRPPRPENRGKALQQNHQNEHQLGFIHLVAFFDVREACVRYRQ